MSEFIPDAKDDDAPLIDDDAPLIEGKKTGVAQGAAVGAPVRPPWKVLIVDDDADVRMVSELALRGITVDGVPVRLLTVDGAAAGRELLKQHRDIAVALVDVVMESETAGLDFIRWIREDLQEPSLRLVVRTGQPGNAPEAIVTQSYDIHDYLSKAETTARRLVTCVTGAIRAWRDLETIHRQRSGMQRVLEAVDALFESPAIEQLLAKVLEQVKALLTPHACHGVFAGAWRLHRSEPKEFRIRAASGVLSGLAGRTIDDTLPVELRPCLDDSPPMGRLTPSGTGHVYCFSVADDVSLRLVLFAENLQSWERELVELYCHAVSLALRNRILWEKTVAEISHTLSEREVLLKEIHHRVKNNLQIVSSMLSLQSAKDLSEEARAAIIDSGLRVRSISLVHHLLYGSRDFLHIDLSDAVRDLSNIILASLEQSGNVVLDTEPVQVSVEQAIPCCLIVNEIITNALKHGRSADGSCRIRIRTRSEEGHLVLEIGDEGPGLPADFETRRSDSLGVSIIKSLIGQMRGKLVTSSSPGATFHITVPLVPATEDQRLS
jgi:two-component sensor histidine kinase